MKENKVKDYRVYDENGEKYLYYRSRLIEAFLREKEKRGITRDELRWLIYEETGISAETVQNHLRSKEDRGADNPKTIETVKKYGKLLLGNEYALLTPVPDQGEVSAKRAEELHSEAVKAVFGMLYDILALYEASDRYNYIPDTDNADGAWEYFEGLIGNVRKRLTSDLLGKRGSAEYQKLERIIDETEVFVKSCSVPGVVKRWQAINPQINFFDCVFDLIDELGMETVRELNREGRLAFFPSAYFIRARDMYFAKKVMRNVEGNLQYTETRLFQNELLQTLAMVFENDFGGEENSRVT